jgi:heptaprenyl diphosphate synthase
MNVWELLPLPGLDSALARVELELREVVASPGPILAEAASHLVGAGGKRLRPALLVTAAAATGAPATDEVVLGAAAVELVHMGSIYHDDVIDEATTRRGVPSANARWGNLVAILTGDFLLARASEIAAGLGTEVVRVLAATIGQLCEGEVSQLHDAFSTQRTEVSYFESISRKTASLIAASTQIGGIVAGASQGDVACLAHFGHALGMAFQIYDDVRDLLCSEEELGKPAGNDLLEGTYTLPVIRALADEACRPELVSLLRPELSLQDVERARDIVLASGAIASSVGEARRWAEKAALALGELGPLPTAHAGLARETLAGIAHKLLDGLAVPTG